MVTSTPRRAVFLDRDGFLTVPEFRDGRSYAPRRLEDFRVYAETADSAATMKKAGHQPAGCRARSIRAQRRRRDAPTAGDYAPVDAIEARGRLHKELYDR
jgi:hypothetical protein